MRRPTRLVKLHVLHESRFGYARTASSAGLLAIAGAFLVASVASGPARAVDSASKPATTSTASQPTVTHLSATVTAVKGLVQYRESAAQPWKPCEVGLVLGEGAEFQTGPRSAVQLALPPKQTVTLDRFGSMSLLKAVQSSGKVNTDFGLKKGRVRYNIDAPGVEHESTVSSPNGTLAVRDTSFAVDDEGPFPIEAYRLSGTVDFSTAKRTLSIGGAVAGNVRAVGDQAPPQTALSLAVVDPSVALARSPAEVPLVANVLSQGAVLEESDPKRIRVVSGGTPPTDTQLPKVLPGSLDFVVRWDGNANLNLGLINTHNGETLYPATGVNSSPSGGYIPFDDIGGPNGGIEFAWWNSPYPHGIYALDVVNVSGAPVNYKIDVFEHGVRDTLYSSLPTIFNNVPGVTTLTGTISAGQAVPGFVLVGGGSLVPPTPVAPTPPPNPVGTAVKIRPAGRNTVPTGSTGLVRRTR